MSHHREIGLFNANHPRLEDGYMDQSSYTAFHFNGTRLAYSLTKASDFLLELEKQTQREPYPLAVRVQPSTEDTSGDLSWQVTVVLCDLMLNGD
jgi:hypothetical protein